MIHVRRRCGEWVIESGEAKLKATVGGAVEGGVIVLYRKRLIPVGRVDYSC